MRTIDERVAVAAEAYRRYIGEAPSPFNATDIARVVVRAALADVLDGSAWVAPTEPPREMLGQMTGLTDFLLPDAIGNTVADHLREMRLAYTIGRDAWLAPTGRETSGEET